MKKNGYYIGQGPEGLVKMNDFKTKNGIEKKCKNCKFYKQSELECKNVEIMLHVYFQSDNKGFPMALRFNPEFGCIFWE